MDTFRDSVVSENHEFIICKDLNNLFFNFKHKNTMIFPFFLSISIEKERERERYAQML